MQISAKELQTHVERKAYALGVSQVVCTLLGEDILEFLKQRYVRRNKEQLVSKTTG